MPGHHPARPTSPRLGRASIVLALALALSALAGASGADARGRPPLARTNYIERTVVQKIDAFRRHFGLRPLRLDGRLARGADAHTSDMLAHGYFAHDSFSGSWSGRVRHYAGGAHGVGEVIGYLRRVPRQRQAAEIVSLWIHSPPHRAVLLSSYARLGVGRRVGNFYGYRSAVFTVDFATR